jgi:MFS family permease
MNPKNVLGLCLFLNISTLVIFTVTDLFPVLAVCRMGTGLFQVFFCIYFPVWADVYGDEIQKSKWLTYLLIASPLGVIMGYGMCAAFLNNVGWRWAFYIQSVLLLPSLFGIIMTPRKYLDVKLAS